MALVPVRFTSQVAPYNAGEVAGFPAEQAAYFIERRVAVPYDPDEPDPDPTTVEGLLWGSVADVMRRVGNTEDRELLVAALVAELAGERRRVALEAINERQFQLRVGFPEAEAKDGVVAQRPAPPPLVDDDPGESPLAGTITEVTDHVLGVDDIELLQRWHREETVSGGRAAVLSAIEERLASLGHAVSDRPRGDDEPRPVTKGGGPLGRLVSGAARRLRPSKIEQERKARRRRAEAEQRRRQEIIDQAIADGIEIWGINDRPSSGVPWRWRDW